MVIDGIDKVDWSSLQDAYGPATETPRHLRGLLSTSTKVREAAYDFFYTNVLHQASIYEAAIEVVPFLVALVGESGTPERAQLLELLSDFYSGGSWHEIHRSSVLLSERSETSEYQQKNMAEVGWIDEVHRRIRAGTPAYLECMNDSDADVRLRAVGLVAWFSEHADQLRDALLTVSQKDRSTEVRANSICALAILGCTERNELGPDHKDETALVRVVVALQRHLRWDNPPEASSRILLDALDDSELLTQLGGVPLVGDVWEAVGAAFSACPPEVRAEALTKACEGFEAASAGSQWMMDGSAIGLLRLAFEHPYESGATLSDPQLRAVAVVARQAWGAFGGYINMINVLRAFGLPDREEVMRELLGLERFPKVETKFPKKVAMKKPWWKFWG